MLADLTRPTRPDQLTPGHRRRSLSRIGLEVCRLPPGDFDAAVTYLLEEAPLDGALCPRFLTGDGPNQPTLHALSVRRPDKKGMVRYSANQLALIVALWAQDYPRAFARPAWRPSLCVCGEVSIG